MESDYGRFSGITFSGVFQSFEIFKEEWENCPFYNRYKDELNDVVEETFYMLYSDFGKFYYKIQRHQQIQDKAV